MAQFDVHLNPEGLMLLDCQTDLLAIETRLVVPLIPRNQVVNLVRRLNPILTVNDVEYVMMTPTMSSVRASTLGRRVASLIEEQDAIKAAIDMLLSGF
jgi:toxin CcdB